ncbi:MAG: peptidylprolyl isomerase [Leeuwenhoekiella sp.]
MKKLFAFALLLLATAISCDDKYPELEDGLYAEIITNKGTMIARLYFQEAPATVANFVSLAEGTNESVSEEYVGKPYYNGLTFHRIMEDFMIQGGDPDGTGSGGPGYKFHDELSPELRHDTIGVLSMANSGYGTNGSQFFITHRATPHLDGYDESGNLKNCEDPRTSCHSVFGELVEGYETLHTIAAVEEPKKDKVVIKEMNIIRKGGAARKFDAYETFEDELKMKKAEEEALQKKLEAMQTETKARFEKQREQAQNLDSGLSIYFSERGDGEKPKLSQKVVVDYAGYYENGELFDTNVKEIADSWNKQTRPDPSMYEPLTPVYSSEARLIAGMKEGLQEMSIGDKATLFIPYHMGYGERDYGPIPGKSNLIFEVELLGLAND